METTMRPFLLFMKRRLMGIAIAALICAAHASEDARSKTPDKKITGRVAAPSNDPMADVSVAVYPPLFPEWKWRVWSSKHPAPSGAVLPRSMAETKTDSLGRFAVTLPPGGETFTAVFYREGCAPMTLPLDNIPAVIVYPCEDNAASIRLCDAENRGIENLAFSLTEDAGAWRPPVHEFLPPALRDAFVTGEDGIAQLPPLPPGPYRISFSESGVYMKENAVLEIGKRVDVSFCMPDAKAIQGQIVDVYGNPVASAHVRCSVNVRGDGGRPGETISAAVNSDGRFTLYFSTDDEFFGHAYIFAEGYAPEAFLLEEIPPVVVLKKAGSLMASVLDEDGKPLPKFRYEIKSLSPSLWPTRNALTGEVSDVRGSIEIKNVVPGARKLRLSAEGFLTTELEVQVTSGENAKIGDVRLRRGKRLCMKVQNAQGKAVEAAQAVLIAVDAEKFAHDFVARADSDAEGMVEFFGLDAGQYRAEIKHPDYTRYEKEVKMDRDRKDDAPCESVILESGCAWEAAAIDSEGRPLAQAQVWALSSQGMEGAPVETDANGRFKLAHVPPGEVTLVIRKDFHVFAYATENPCTEQDGAAMFRPSGAPVCGRITWDGAPYDIPLILSGVPGLALAKQQGNFCFHGLDALPSREAVVYINQRPGGPLPETVGMILEAPSVSPSDIELHRAEVYGAVPTCHLRNTDVGVFAVPSASAPLFQQTFMWGVRGGVQSGVTAQGEFYLTFSSLGAYTLFVVAYDGNVVARHEIHLQPGDSKYINVNAPCP